MTRDELMADLASRLCLQMRRRELLPQDIARFVLQGVLGPGQLPASREALAEALAQEMAALTPDPREELTEQLSPAWCRLNLRRALAEGLSPGILSGLMTVLPDSSSLTTDDASAFLLTLPFFPRPGESGAPPWDAHHFPSHSDAYLARYGPAYRVIPSGFIPCLPAILELSRFLSSRRRVLVTLDGPCACGKTTLAGLLGEVFEAPVVHTDDFVVPHALKTPERLAIPGGNCDAERLSREVLLPWKEGVPAFVRPYDCHADAFLTAQPLPEGPLLILEGSYCNLPLLRQSADLRLFMEVPREIRRSRLERRESPASLLNFDRRWIPLENAYFSHYGLPDGDMLLLRPVTDTLP